ncbi:hypothetical protein [Sphingomicrobium sediminis]|uniref:Peptidase M10 metallopeptidase domain-containing protein n=1 Tax=Sphingomicrobium sediminis TaxID=2950949 RepID=A0A9X2EHG5_9SPHN|nr:hypothetical protein [Sphingomicrobium sediminis]MCM8557645.1 hypothetical protein [Sphingomicrobium sediminis]
MTKKWVLGGCAAVVLGGAAMAGTGHQWGNYRWGPGNEPVTLELSYKFSAATEAKWLPYYSQASYNAIEKWDSNSQSPLTLIEKGEAAGKTSAGCEPIAGEIIVCADEYGTNQGWVGIAQIWASGDQITQATAKMNDSYYEYNSFYDTPGQREFVMCHEIGHTFGLGHLDTNFNNGNLGSCMDYTSNPAGPPDNRDPGQVDWDVLNSSTMYGAADSGGGGGGGRGGGKPDKGDGGGGGPPPGKGKNKLGALPASETGLERGRFGGVVGYDAEGRPNQFLRDMRGGAKRYTFVMWAKGYRPEGSRRR